MESSSGLVNISTNVEYFSNLKVRKEKDVTTENEVQWRAYTSCSHQCFLFSRNIGKLTPKLVYFYYLKKNILDHSIQQIFCLILKKDALVHILQAMLKGFQHWFITWQSIQESRWDWKWNTSLLNHKLETVKQLKHRTHHVFLVTFTEPEGVRADFKMCKIIPMKSVQTTVSHELCSVTVCGGKQWIAFSRCIGQVNQKIAVADCIPKYC